MQECLPHATDIPYPDAGDCRILSNSAMWQSERWNRTVQRVKVEDSFAGAIKLAWHLVRERGKYDAVYTVGVREAQMYGLLCALFGTGNRPHIATEILLDEARSGSVAWKVKRRIRRFAFHKVARVIVFSSAERELYSRELDVPLERVEFVPFHTNVLESRFTRLGEYGFAAGRSLRDYKTFFAAVEGLDFAFVVVADRAGVADLKIPSNVVLHCDIPRERYLELLEGARFVVVPLRADYRSTGQVVVLEAASLGKPVIASAVVGTRDYITHGANGLLVPPGIVEELRSEIKHLMHDDALCEKLTASAMQRIEKYHTFKAFADRCLEIIADACRKPRPSA